jgi:MSHA biogenesis protein MshK
MVAALPLCAQDAPLADPTRPALRNPGGAGARTASGLRLEGIVISADRKLALISGEFLAEGDQIYGLRIERIDRDKVTARRNGQTLVLRPESAVPEAEAESGESP